MPVGHRERDHDELGEYEGGVGDADDVDELVFEEEQSAEHDDTA